MRTSKIDKDDDFGNTIPADLEEIMNSLPLVNEDKLAALEIYVTSPDNRNLFVSTRKRIIFI